MPPFSVFSLIGFTCSFVRCAIKERNTSSGWLSDGKWQLLFSPSQVIVPRSVSELYSQSVGCDWCGTELSSQSVFSLFQKVKRGHCGYFFRVEYVWTLILAFCPKWEMRRFGAERISYDSRGLLLKYCELDVLDI